MGVFDFEENRLRQQEIEVKALVALAAHGSKPQQWRAIWDYGFPDKLAEDINQETL